MAGWWEWLLAKSFEDIHCQSHYSSLGGLQNSYLWIAYIYREHPIVIVSFCSEYTSHFITLLLKQRLYGDARWCHWSRPCKLVANSVPTLQIPSHIAHKKLHSYIVFLPSIKCKLQIIMVILMIHTGHPQWSSIQSVIHLWPHLRWLCLLTITSPISTPLGALTAASWLGNQDSNVFQCDLVLKVSRLGEMLKLTQSNYDEFNESARFFPTIHGIFHIFDLPPKKLQQIHSRGLFAASLTRSHVTSSDVTFDRPNQEMMNWGSK